MKSLQTLALGMAIGVLALLANTRPAAAAVAHHHHRAVQRLTCSILASSARGNGSHSGSRPSRRPAPPPPSSRSATRVRSHQHPSRFRPDYQADIANVRGLRPQTVAWRINASHALTRGFSDASVTSERGPPTAGSQLSFALLLRSATKLTSQPRPESQSHLRTQQTQFSSQIDPPHSLVRFPVVLAAFIPGVFPWGLFGPLRAGRQEGTAARNETPSLGDHR